MASLSQMIKIEPHCRQQGSARRVALAEPPHCDGEFDRHWDNFLLHIFTSGLHRGGGGWVGLGSILYTDVELSFRTSLVNNINN